MSTIFEELKRRNVFKVATTYLVVGWLTLQVFDSVAEPLGFPEWVQSFIIVLIGVGFPIAIIFAWAFELTPDGVKPTSDVDAGASITKDTSRKMDLIIIGALVLIIGGMAFTGEFGSSNISQGEKSEAVEGAKTVAVLPFVDMSPNKDQDWFSDGLTEEILNSLVMLPELQVTARTSSFHFKGQNLPVPEIAKKLGVAYVVEGSVRRGGDTLRITAQLIKAEDGSHLWSATYDKPASDVLNVQRNVAESIAQALDVVLDDKRRQEMFASGTHNVKAFEAYHKGYAYSKLVHDLMKSEKNLWEANVYFAQAMAADPSFAAPHVEAQDAYSHFLNEGPNADFLRNSEPAGLDNIQALKKYQFHQKMAIQLTSDPKTKLEAEISQIFTSDNWRGLRRKLHTLRENPSMIGLNANNWIVEILNGLGAANIILPQLREKIVNSPYDRFGWGYLIKHLIFNGKFEEVQKVIKQSKEYGFDSEDVSIVFYVFSNNQEKLEELYKQKIQKGENPTAFLLAAVGKREEALKQYAQTTQNRKAYESDVWLCHLMGEQNKANTLTRQFDGEPLGALALANMITSFGKIYAPMESAPNYVRKLRQVGLSEEKIQSMFLPSGVKGQ